MSPPGHMARPVITVAARPSLSATPNTPLAARTVGVARALWCAAPALPGGRQGHQTEHSCMQ